MGVGIDWRKELTISMWSMGMNIPQRGGPVTDTPIDNRCECLPHSRREMREITGSREEEASQEDQGSPK